MSPASDNSDDVSLRDADDVKERNVGRTAVEAAAALDTVLYSILLKFIHHCVACILLKKERLETHRAGLCTLSATDTSRLDTTYCLLCSQIKKR